MQMSITACTIVQSIQEDDMAFAIKLDVVLASKQ